MRAVVRSSASITKTIEMPTKDRNRILVTKATKGRMSGSTVEKEINNAATMLQSSATAVNLKVDAQCANSCCSLIKVGNAPRISSGPGITLGMIMIQKRTSITNVNK